MGDKFPWLLVQDVSALFQKKGTTMVNSVLYMPTKLFDCLRLLEVVRTVCPCGVFSTLFNMVRYVVPNVDSKVYTRMPPRDVLLNRRIPPDNACKRLCL